MRIASPVAVALALLVVSAGNAGALAARHAATAAPSSSAAAAQARPDPASPEPATAVAPPQTAPPAPVPPPVRPQAAVPLPAAPQPSLAPTPAPRPSRTPPSAATPLPAPEPRRQQPPTPPAPSGPTGWVELDREIAALPGYDGAATWRVSDEHGTWGTADLAAATVYISPRVPHKRLRDVVLHEWSHLLQVRSYPTVQDAVDDLNRFYGGSGIEGLELAADCMALELGATWTNYTACRDARWRDAARHLLRGERPPN